MPVRKKFNVSPDWNWPPQKRCASLQKTSLTLSGTALCLRLLFPVSLATLSSSALANDTLNSVCRSDPASIQAMLADPLLADFFEMTCGPQALQAARQAGPVNAQPEAAVSQPVFQDPSPANQNRAFIPQGLAEPEAQDTKPAIDASVVEQPSPELANKPRPAPPGAVFSKFRFEGRLAIGQEDLARAVTPLMGQSITRERLTYLTQVLAKTYREQGWLVAIHLPDQDVSDGTVTVQVKEAIFQGAAVSDPRGALRNSNIAKAIVEGTQPVGEPVNLEQVKEAQARLNDLPGVTAQLNLTKGAEDNQTQGIVQVTEQPASRVSISADNSGARSTGRERVIAALTVNNPSFRGDQFVAQLMASEGLKYGSLEYSLPFGYRPWRYGLRLSTMNYELISPDYAGLDAKGPTQNASMFLQMPLVRTPRSRVVLNANLGTNRFKHELNDATYSRYKSDVLSLGWGSSTMNLLPGANQTSTDFQISRGRIDLSNSTQAHQESDAATVQTEGWFSKARLGLSHRQFFTPKTSLFTSVRGQWSDKNLDGSEKFSLGGSGGVRAYPTGEASGSMGGIASLELQHREQFRRGSISLAGFYDYGEIKLYQDNEFESATGPNGYILKGYGLWLGTEYAMSDSLFGLRFTWARRHGENPGRNADTGLDQDGTLDKDRFWVDAYLRY
jgi:hemolysin activation/secretion protein